MSQAKTHMEPRDERRIRGLIKGAEWASGGALLGLGLLLPATAAGHVELRIAITVGCLIASVTMFSLSMLWLPSARAYSVIEPVQEILAVVIVSLGVALTGGASSPYFGFIFYPVLYSAFFLRGRIVVAVTAAACAGAAAPLVYDSAATRLDWLSSWVVISTSASVLAAILFAYKRRLEVAERRARHDAMTDPLSGILNRFGFETTVAAAVGVPSSEPCDAAVVVFDVDNFKDFNSAHGHAGGDAVIRSVAAILAEAAGDAVAGRIGGDEFAVCLPNGTTEDAQAIATRCVSAIGAVSVPEVDNAKLSITAGCASSPADGETIDELMLIADDALFVAKADLMRTETDSREHASESRHAGPTRHEFASLGFEAAPTAVSDSSFTAVWREIVGDRSLTSIAASGAWLGGALLAAIVMALSDLHRENIAPVAAIGGASAVLGAFTFVFWRYLSSTFYAIANVVSTAGIGFVIYFTGQGQSAFLPVLFFVVAFAASFFDIRAALTRIGFAVFVFASPFLYLSGDPLQVYVINFLVMATAAVIAAFSIIYSKRQLEFAEAASLEQSLTDRLTGLGNRRALAEVFDAAIASQSAIGLCVVDLDNFKQVNTDFGHHGGDAFLKAFSSALVGAVRSEDRVARIGGDEFAILVAADDPDDIVDISARAVAAANVVNSLERWRKCGVTASVGYTLSVGPGDSLDLMIDDADRALMTVKSSGKNAFAASPRATSVTPLLAG
ncbi:MAG: GGDEF domain-containing protein [Solirubrobacterales bacterium]